jgi:Zn-dependent M16 (insulinase) family peptidase
MIRLLVGDTDEIRQRMRDEILATTRADFLAFADALDQVREKGLIVVLGGPAAVEAANRERSGRLEITRVLG